MGGHLFAAFEGGMFAVWETARWNMERFDYPGRFCAAAWASDGMRLAIVLDHLDVEDRCWVVDEMAPGPGSQGGVDWTPSTFLNDLDSGLGPLLGGYHGDSRFVRVVKDCKVNSPGTQPPGYWAVLVAHLQKQPGHASPHSRWMKTTRRTCN